MDFDYTAKSSSGETVTGVLTAEGEQYAHQQLREQGLFIIGVRPRGQRGVLPTVGRRKYARIKKRELLTLTTQLAIMSRAGIDSASALDCLAQHCQSVRLKPILQDVLAAVESGQSLSDGLCRYPQVFNEAYTASVAAGEAAGRLPDVLGHLAQLQRSEVARRATLRGLIAYPLLLSVVSSLVIAGLVCFVLPEFAQVFQDMDMPLPAITQTLLGVSSLIHDGFWLWAPALFVGVVGLRFALRSHRGRQVLDRAVMNVVLWRDITRALLVGRTFRLLGMLIESGVPVLDAVRLVGRSVSNQVFRSVFEQMQDDLLNGRMLSHSLAEMHILPPETTEMIVTAERTGTLGMVTLLMGQHCEEQGEEMLRDLATILEPTIVVVMGILVGLIVLAVMLPMFDMATLAGG